MKHEDYKKVRAERNFKEQERRVEMMATLNKKALDAGKPELVGKPLAVSIGVKGWNPNAKAYKPLYIPLAEWERLKVKRKPQTKIHYLKSKKKNPLGTQIKKIPWGRRQILLERFIEKTRIKLDKEQELENEYHEV